MRKLELTAELRSDRKRGALRRARKAGRVPGVIYGESGSDAIFLDDRQLRNILRQTASGAALITLKCGQGERLSVVASFQRDPLSDALIHVDLQEVSAQKKMHAHIPVTLTGMEECVGVRLENGVLEFLTHSVEVRCLPNDLPETWTVDVSQMHVDQILHLKDLRTVEAVELLGSPEQVIVICATTKAQESAEGEAESGDGDSAKVAAEQLAKEKEKA
jgi:large subunit ribosomal protein L25